MKIEKINDNQIKCILNKSDLETRNINPSELAYGTDKANELFREMTEQADKKFGFKIDNTPIMIEAIPLPNESIALIITKIEDPEELDTRFSKFSPSKEDFETARSMETELAKGKLNKANEILNLLNSFKDVLADSSKKLASSGSDNKSEPSSDKTSGNDGSGSAKECSSINKNLIMIYSFKNIDTIIELSKVLASRYNGTNSLYRKNDTYYLVIDKGPHSPEDFNQICNIICEYGNKTNLTEFSESYLEEHFDLILKSDALKNLANVK